MLRFGKTLKVSLLVFLAGSLINCLPEKDESREIGQIEKSLSDFLIKLPVDCSQNTIELVRKNGEKQLFASINQAVQASGRGDQIQLGEGNFREFVEIKNKEKINLMSGCKAQISGIRIKDSEDIRISGLVIQSEIAGRPAIELVGGKKSSKEIE